MKVTNIEKVNSNVDKLISKKKKLEYDNVNIPMEPDYWFKSNSGVIKLKKIKNIDSKDSLKLSVDIDSHAYLSYKDTGIKFTTIPQFDCDILPGESYKVSFTGLCDDTLNVKLFIIIYNEEKKIQNLLLDINENGEFEVNKKCKKYRVALRFSGKGNVEINSIKFETISKKKISSEENSFTVAKELTYRKKIIEQKKRTIVTRKEKNIINEKLKKEIEEQIINIEKIEKLLVDNNEIKRKNKEEIHVRDMQNEKVLSESNRIKEVNQQEIKIKDMENQKLKDEIKQKCDKIQKINKINEINEQEIKIKDIENERIIKELSIIKGQLDNIEKKYNALSSSKLGSLTVKYWSKKKGKNI